MVKNNTIRVVQLIDSLEAGGAERMAVNYANLLHRKLGFSALITTRSEGQLKKQLENDIVYLFLNKKKIIDIKALNHFKNFVHKYEISHIHAHSSSVFFAVLLKLIIPKIKIIWHDHYGKSEMLNNRPKLALQIASFFVSSIISVNQNLKKWAFEQLFCKNIVYLPNFIGESLEFFIDATNLHGVSGKRIVCLANLRPQKNHHFLLKVAKEIKKSHPEFTFHLVGKDFNDKYSQSIKDEISNLSLTDSVFVYGSREDISNILKQSDIGILTSSSEGLPIAILEYGFHKLPIVATSVGQIPKVIDSGEGILVESNNVEGFIEGLKIIIENTKLKKSLANSIHSKIINNFSEKAVFKLYIDCINEK